MKLRFLAVNALLAGVSLLLAVALAEAVLRLAYPRYQYAAEALYERDTVRIFVRKPDRRRTAARPDTGVEHAIHYNNLALRHHRDLPPESLEGAVNLGFFGDSFTENLRLPVAYAFTEVLDYLLNLGDAEVNVLNFGLDGYGTDQEYLYWRTSDVAKQLDHVFYVFNRRDLSDIYANDLLSLDASGRLVNRMARETPWWLRIASRLHLTYLAWDSRPVQAALRQHRKRHFESYDRRKDTAGRSFKEGREAPDAYRRNTAVFRAILETWRSEVRRAGARFSVVVLPRAPDSDAAAEIVPRDFHLIDLYPRFQARVPGYAWRDFTFRTDGHWAEEGNQLAALELYRELAPDLGGALTGDSLGRAVHTYYAAFDGWMPTRGSRASPETAQERGRIRSRYLALETAAGNEETSSRKRVRRALD